MSEQVDEGARAAVTGLGRGAATVSHPAESVDHFTRKTSDAVKISRGRILHGL